MPLRALTPAVEYTVYSVSGVCMVLSALFAVVVWVKMGQKPAEKVVRHDSLATAKGTAMTELKKSSDTPITHKNSQHVVATTSTDYSKAPPLGYDHVPSEQGSHEYTGPPSTIQIAPVATYDKVAPEGYDSVPPQSASSLPTSRGTAPETHQYVRPGIERRAFSSGDIDFESPEEEVEEPAAVGLRTLAWSDVELGERIGAGSFGEVWSATLGGEAVAVKKLLDPSGNFQREWQVMGSLPAHRNVLRVHGVILEPPAIVTELCEQGSLDQHNKLPYRKLLVVARDIAEGVAHLHKHSIVHRDLAARNLLVKKRIVKVADFGLARVTMEDSYATTATSDGPTKWSAIEVIEKGKFSQAADVWAFGVVLWELATGERPFADMTAAAAAVAIVRGVRLARPADISDELWALMESCWRVDAHARPTMAAICASLAAMLTELARRN